MKLKLKKENITKREEEVEEDKEGKIKSYEEVERRRITCTRNTGMSLKRWYFTNCACHMSPVSVTEWLEVE